MNSRNLRSVPFVTVTGRTLQSKPVAIPSARTVLKNVSLPAPASVPIATDPSEAMTICTLPSDPTLPSRFFLLYYILPPCLICSFCQLILLLVGRSFSDGFMVRCFMTVFLGRLGPAFNYFATSILWVLFISFPLFLVVAYGSTQGLFPFLFMVPFGCWGAE